MQNRRKVNDYIRRIRVAFLFGILSCNGEDKSVPSSKEDQQLSNVRLKDLKGQVINLEKYKGKTIFLNFWATWCKPCLEEMPSIEKAQNILRDKNVVFLMASGETAEEIDVFRNSHNYKLNYVRVENSEELNIQVLPTTFIFSPEGKLVFSEIGYRKWDQKDNIDIIKQTANKND